METETIAIIEKLRQTRIEKKVSLMSLANEVEISRSHLYYIEKRKVSPSVDLVVRLAKALGLSFADFAG
jgi:DNA-binding XRE family transcriptional regulator